jgi:ribosomal protein L7/L12
MTAQRESDRRAGELLVSLLDQPGKAEVDAPLAGGKAVHTVRRVRELTGLRLIDAKRPVDALRIARLEELENSDS